MVPTPKLFMRTVIQTLAVYPKLSGFVLSLLPRLLARRVWEDNVLWDGFIKCCQKLAPVSFSVLMQLPRRQLQDVLSKAPGLGAAMKQHGFLKEDL